jgi:hypothetical protein
VKSGCGWTVLQLYGNITNKVRHEVEQTDSQNSLLFSLFSGNLGITIGLRQTVLLALVVFLLASDL